MPGSILQRLKNSPLAAFLQDQRLPELFRHREFRLSEAFLRRELQAMAADEEVGPLQLFIHDGRIEVRGVVKKRLLPPIPFGVTLRLAGVEFNAMAKRLHLAVEEVKPLDVDWITGRLVARVPFLSHGAGRITIDLERVPRLHLPLTCRIKGVRVADFFTIKELRLKPGEVVGRLGVTL